MRLRSLPEERYLLAGVLVIACLTRGFFITSIQVPFFDEKYNIPAAYNYIERGFIGTVTWYHPNLRNIMLYLSMTIIGDSPLGWRLPWIVIGISSVYLLYLFTYKLLGSKRVAIIASFLLAIDPLHITQSRINPDETMTIFTSIASLFFALRYKEESRPLFLLISGLAIGLGLSVKWYAIFTVVTVFLMCLSCILKKDSFHERFNEFFYVFLALVVLPATVYILTFYPWFGQGYSIADFFMLQRDMYTGLQSLSSSDFEDMSMLTASRPYSWFAFPYIAGFKMITYPGVVIVIPYLSNPFVWLLVLPAIGYTIFCCIKERSFPLFIVFATFLIQYVPLLFIRRPIFIHSALSVLPMALIAIAFALTRILSSGMLKLYLFLNLTLVLAVLPLLINYPLPSDYYNHLKWLDMILSTTGAK